MELVHEFDYRSRLADPVAIGSGPYGYRAFIGILGGVVTGERFRGEILAVGGDSLLVGPDGYGRLDVRAGFRTHDGAVVAMHHTGFLELNDAVVQARVAGGETRFEDQSYRIDPRFETGDERYAWMNRSLFVAEGRIVPGGVAYRVYRVA